MDGTDSEEDADRALRMARFLDSGSLRASLYRNKLQKVLLNPSNPLTNPYRVSNHDQMPVRVIPTSPVAKPLPRRSVTAALMSRKRKTKLNNPDSKISDFKNDNCPSVSDDSHCDADNSCSKLSTSTDSVLKPRNRNCSDVSKPHYLTRNALKRIKELKLGDFNESNFSLLSDEGNSNFMSQSGVRSNKSRKSFHKFNIFSKSSKLKSMSEFALHEARSFENLDVSDAGELNATSIEQEEKKRNRKRRLSGFRSRFQKKSPDEDQIVEKKKRKQNKRKSSVLQNTMCDEDEALSLQDVLANRGLCEEFRDFLSHEHSEENLDFWTICEKYKTSNNQRNLAKVIRRQFLNDGAPREVNLDAKIKFELEESSRILTSESFLGAQQSIYHLMESDSFRRFASARRPKRRKRN